MRVTELTPRAGGTVLAVIHMPGRDERTAYLSVAPRTAEAHVENIRRKLQVRSRAQNAAWVTEQRLRPGAAR
jgi:hypothetical protein